MGSSAAWDTPPPPETVEFFLGRMRAHSKVSRVVTHSDNRHDLFRHGATTIKVFLTDTYEFTVSDYAELHAEYPEVNCIASASTWNHFTYEAEEVANGDGVATFLIAELMGALNFTGAKFRNYVAPQK